MKKYLLYNLVEGAEYGTPENEDRIRKFLKDNSFRCAFMKGAYYSYWVMLVTPDEEMLLRLTFSDDELIESTV